MKQWRRVALCHARANRWLDDLTQPGKSDLNLTDVPPFYDVDLTSFFLHCHHLADYLETFDELDAGSYARADPALQLCRDLVINLKHAAMGSDPWSPHGRSSNFEVGGLVFISTDAEGNASVDEHQPLMMIRLDDGPSLNAHKVANDCVASWEAYGLPRLHVEFH